jgi:hypothetical protein
MLVNGQIWKYLDALVRTANAHPGPLEIRQCIDALPFELDGPGLVNQLATNAVEQGRLSSSIWPYQSNALTPAYGKVDTVHGNNAAERLEEIRSAQKHVGSRRVTLSG